MANLEKIEDKDLREMLAGFKLDSRGWIASPGKFEAEPLYVPYLWDATLNGFCEIESDDVNPDSYVVEIDATDVEIFPELAGMTHALLWESDNGFVFCDLETREKEVA
jgi:hypothetical protein